MLASSTSRNVFAGGLAWLLLAVCAPLAAQEPLARGERDQARRLFERADALLVEGRFAEARDLLRSSLEAFAHTATAFNLAVALRGTGDAVGASEILTELLDERFGTLRPGQREEAESLRAELETEIVTVALRICGGQDVAVRFDGELWERFDECRSLTRRANPGRHVITVSGAGRLPLEETVQLTRGEPLRLERTLAEMPTGELVVRVPEDDVEVEVVGVGRGIGGFTRRLPAGPYTVRAYLDREAPEERVVTLEAGGSFEVSIGGGDDTLVVALVVSALAGLVAAGGVVLALLLVDRQRPLVEDDVFGVTETLGARPLRPTAIGIRF